MTESRQQAIYCSFVFNSCFDGLWIFKLYKNKEELVYSLDNWQSWEISEQGLNVKEEFVHLILFSLMVGPKWPNKLLTLTFQDTESSDQMLSQTSCINLYRELK